MCFWGVLEKSVLLNNLKGLNPVAAPDSTVRVKEGGRGGGGGGGVEGGLNKGAGEE